jgi:signal transduction histidine kinase
VSQTAAIDNRARRPFELVRYFTAISLVILLLFTMVISSIVGSRTNDLILYKKEQYALLLAENLNHQVMIRFVLPTIMMYGRINVGDPQPEILLDNVVRNAIRSFKVKRVDLLDLQGNIIYSTSPEYVGRVSLPNPGFKQAAAGGNMALLAPPLGFYDSGARSNRVFKFFSPLRDENRFTAEFGEPKAVFEITLDINEDFEEVSANQAMLAAALLLLMAFLFVILRSIVTRGYRIMDNRAMQHARLKEQLNQSEKLAALGQMVAGVAHEIKNPLGIVRSTAELLATKTEGVQKKLAQVIVEESTRLNGVVNEFLDFARPQKANLQPCPPREVLSRLCLFLESQMQESHISLTIHDLSGSEKALLDSEQIYRAFFNIITNSMQAMEKNPPEKKQLDITIKPAEFDSRSWLSIVFDDSGPGFPPDFAMRIFEPFFTTKDNGTGLGLSIVKAIVEAHGGRIEVENNDRSGGRVTVSLRV